jgi:cytochrome P450
VALHLQTLHQPHIFHPWVVGFYLAWEVIHVTRKYGTSTFSSKWLRVFSLAWVVLDLLTIGFGLMRHGYLKSSSRLGDMVYFSVGVLTMTAAAVLEGPPNRNAKYASIPVTAFCMWQVTIDTLYHPDEYLASTYVPIAWFIAVGNIFGAFATWHKMPWGVWGKLSWILVSFFSLTFIGVVHLRLANQTDFVVASISAVYFWGVSYSSHMFALLGFTILLWYFGQHARPTLRRPPQPYHWWQPLGLIRLALLFKRDTMAALQESRKRCGDTFSLHVLDRVVYLTFDPAMVQKYVSREWASKLDFYEPTSKNISALIDVLADVQPYKTLASQTLLNSKVLSGWQEGPIKAEIRQGLANLVDRNGREVDICDQLGLVLFRSLLRVLVGGGETTDHAREFQQRMQFVISNINNPLVRFLPPWWPFEKIQRFHSSKTWFVDTIRKALNTENTEGTYLSRISRDTEKDAFHVFAMLYGANVNTIPTAIIAAVLLSLPEHAELLDELVHYLADVEGQEAAGSAWDLSQFDLLDKLLAETLRLYPVRVLTRVTKEDIEVDDYVVPRGSWFLLSPYWLHRDNEVFPDAEKFLPNRWKSDGDIQQLKHSGQYVSFGFGEHSCLGHRLARIIFKMFLREFFSSYRLHLKEGQSYDIVYFSKKRGFRQQIVGDIVKLNH